MPSRIPDGLAVAQTSRGVVITSNPSKIKIIDQGSERDVGMALFGYAHDQLKGFDNVAVAMDRNGIPVAELAIKPGQEKQAMRAASLLAPETGSTNMMSRGDVISTRLKGLLD